MNTISKKIIYSQSRLYVLLLLLILSFPLLALLVGGYNLIIAENWIGFLLLVLGLLLLYVIGQMLLNPERIIVSEAGVEITKFKEFKVIPWKRIQNITVQSPKPHHQLANFLFLLMPGGAGDFVPELCIEVTPEAEAQNSDLIFLRVYSGLKAQELANTLTEIKSKHSK